MIKNTICFDRISFFIGILVMIIFVYLLIYLYFKNMEDVTITDLSKHVIISMRDIEKNMIVKNNLNNQTQNENIVSCNNTQNVPKLNDVYETTLPNIIQNDNKKKSCGCSVEVPCNCNKDFGSCNCDINEKSINILPQIPRQHIIEPTIILNKPEYIEPKHNIDTKLYLANNQVGNIINLPNNHDLVTMRDRAVLNDPLYPPLNRTERPIFEEIVNNMNINIPTRGSEDTFRQIGFIVNTNKSEMDMGNNNWKLYGRQTYRGSSIGEFYVIPVNDFKADMKVYLKDNMMVGEKIRDIYALPSQVKFKSPFFTQDEYEIIELPKTDFNSRYL